MVTVEREIEFSSQGVTCRGLFVRPNSKTPAPLIVLGHGLGGVYEMRLDAYARTFAEAGYAALTFDYRRFGRSDGHPRHWLVREHQQQDFEAAVDYGKTLDGVDPTKVVLWGTSLAGGHVLDIASRRSDVTASIIQGPFTDGIASTRAISLLSLMGLGFLITADVFARLLRRPPVLAPLAGTYGTPALMTHEDVVQSVLQLFPSGSRFSKQLSTLYDSFARKKIALPAGMSTSDDPEQFPIARFTGSIRLPSGTVLITGVSAIFGLKIGFWRPGKNMKKLRTPMLVCVCEKDSVAPPGPTIAYAQAASACELKRYPYGHFDIYTGDPYALITTDQLAFLERVVPAPRHSQGDGPGTVRDNCIEPQRAHGPRGCAFRNRCSFALCGGGDGGLWCRIKRTHRTAGVEEVDRTACDPESAAPITPPRRSRTVARLGRRDRFLPGRGNTALDQRGEGGQRWVRGGQGRRAAASRRTLCFEDNRQN